MLACPFECHGDSVLASDRGQLRGGWEGHLPRRGVPGEVHHEDLVVAGPTVPVGHPAPIRREPLAVLVPGRPGHAAARSGLDVQEPEVGVRPIVPLQLRPPVERIAQQPTVARDVRGPVVAVVPMAQRLRAGAVGPHPPQMVRVALDLPVVEDPLPVRGPPRPAEIPHLLEQSPDRAGLDVDDHQVVVPGRARPHLDEDDLAAVRREGRPALRLPSFGQPAQTAPVEAHDPDLPVAVAVAHQREEVVDRARIGVPGTERPVGQPAQPRSVGADSPELREPLLAGLLENDLTTVPRPGRRRVRAPDRIERRHPGRLLHPVEAPRRRAGGLRGGRVGESEGEKKSRERSSDPAAVPACGAEVHGLRIARRRGVGQGGCREAIVRCRQWAPRGPAPQKTRIDVRRVRGRGPCSHDRGVP